MSRRYCGRVGGAVVATDGRCPECGMAWAQHRELPDDVCGTWVRCVADCGADGDGRTLRVHGHLCARAPGHDGAHGVDAGVMAQSAPRSGR